MSFEALHKEYTIKRLQDMIDYIKKSNNDVLVTDFTERKIGKDDFFLSGDRMVEKRQIVISYNVTVSRLNHIADGKRTHGFNIQENS